MALPSTGPLSGGQIDGEFPNTVDGGTPMSLSEYRGVRISTGNLPSSPNPISYSNFRGISYGYFIDILVVGGGGGGGAPFGGLSAGGGGGGGFANSVNNLFVSSGQQFSVFVGRGGAGGVYPGNVGEGGTRVSQGMDGTSSSFNYNGIIYTGRGGGGGGGCRITSEYVGRAGGCGGGAAGFTVGSVSGGDGNPGGDGGGVDASSSNKEGGGGGGTTRNGGFGQVNGPNGVGGRGFNLAAWMGTATYRDGNRAYVDGKYGFGVVNDGGGVGGGGGGGRTTSENYVQGADGGGWGCFRVSANNSGDQLRSGINLTGGGGGGGASANGAGEGGSGVVIVRYRGATALGSGGSIVGGVVNNTNYIFHIFGTTASYTTNVSAIFTA